MIKKWIRNWLGIESMQGTVDLFNAEYKQIVFDKLISQLAESVKARKEQEAQQQDERF